MSLKTIGAVRVAVASAQCLERVPREEPKIRLRLGREQLRLRCECGGSIQTLGRQALGCSGAQRRQCNTALPLTTVRVCTALRRRRVVPPYVGLPVRLRRVRLAMT